MNILTSDTPYSYIWHKYRPVVLRLMMSAKDGPQQYQFSSHEFRRMFPRNREKLAFILYVHRSKAVNNIKTSPLAHALLGILKESKTAVHLTDSSTFELVLDEKFILHVRKNEIPANTSDITSEIDVSQEAVSAE